MRNAVVRLALLALVALIAGAAWQALLRDGGDDEERAPAARRERLYAVAQDDIASVAVRTADGEAAFRRSEDGSWAFDADPPLPVNPDRWGGVTLLLSGPEVERVLVAADMGGATDGDADEFGLDAPSAVVRVGLADGSAVTARLGDSTPDGRNVYAQVEGRDAVALVNAPWGEALTRLATDPPFPSWLYAVDPARVRLFEVERDGRAVTFLLGLTETDGEASARVHAGGEARGLTADERAALLDIAGGPGELRVLAPDSASGPGELRVFAPDSAGGPGEFRVLAPDAADVAETGLREPSLIVRVSYERLAPADGPRLASAVYAIGARLPDGAAYYAATQDADYLLTFDAAWVEAASALAARFGG